MSDLILTIYEEAIIPGSEEERVLGAIKAGCYEITILGVNYIIDEYKHQTFSPGGIWKSESNQYKISATRLIPAKFPEIRTHR